MTKSSREHTKGFKEEAVRLAVKAGPVKTTAEGLGIPIGTLSTWMHALKNKGSLSNTDYCGAKSMSDLLEENRRLHKELAIAQEEREILKKATSISNRSFSRRKHANSICYTF